MHGHPAGARIRNVQFSPDGSRLAYTVDHPDRIQLYVADVATATSRRIGDFAVNDVVSGPPYRWFSDNRSLAVLAVPEDRGAVPSAPLAPSGPVIQENIDGKAPARTYQDLLQNPHDEGLVPVLHAIRGTGCVAGWEGAALGGFGIDCECASVA